MSQGIGSHGTTVLVRPSIADPSGGSLWTAGQQIAIAELGDITMPGFTRKEFDITPHNKNIDQYLFGVLRRELCKFPLFLNKAILSHKVIRAMQMNNDPLTNMLNEFLFTTPDTQTFLFSGGCKDFTEGAPVDGALTGEISIRATGLCYLDGILYGS